MAKQRTIANEVTLTGVGLHTGENVTMKFVPAWRTTALLLNV